MEGGGVARVYGTMSGLIMVGGGQRRGWGTLAGRVRTGSDVIRENPVGNASVERTTPNQKSFIGVISTQHCGEDNSRGRIVDAGGMTLSDEDIAHINMEHRGNKWVSEVCIIPEAHTTSWARRRLGVYGRGQLPTDIHNVTSAATEFWRKAEGGGNGQGKRTRATAMGNGKEGTTPYSLPVPLRLPLGLREATERELKNGLGEG